MRSSATARPLCRPTSSRPRTVSASFSTSPHTVLPPGRPLSFTRGTPSWDRARSPRAPLDAKPHRTARRYAREEEALAVTDEITLTIPRDRALYSVAHLVLGGLGIRLNLTIEHLEDLQLAVDA